MSKWEKVALKHIGEIVTGNTPSTKIDDYYNSNDIPFYKPNDISNTEVSKLNIATSYISETARSCARIIPCNSILVTCIGIIGKTAITTTECSCNQQINAIIPYKDLANSLYLAYAIMSKKTYMQDTANAPIVPIINKTKFASIEIPLPPLKEQHKIASILDTVSETLKLRKQQLNELDLLVKSKFVEMFGDPVTNEKNWEIDKLGKLGELNRGVSKHRPRNDASLLNGAYPLIQTGEVSNTDLYIKSYKNTYSELGLKQSRLWKSGTLCITIAANIAQTSILTFDACFPDSIVGFNSYKKTNQIFIHFWFSFFQRILEEQAPYVAQKNINLKILNNLNVIVPPIEFQNKFASFVQHVDKLKSEVQKSINQLQTLLDSLMQQYFE